MEDFNAVAATLRAGLSDIRACLILSRDGLILGGYPEGAEFDAKPAWLKLAAMGEPERGFLQFGTETWCFVRRGPYAALAVTGTAIRPGLVIEQMDRVLFTAEETRARREGAPIMGSGPAPTTKPRTQLHPDPIPEDEKVVIHLEPSSLFGDEGRSPERPEPAAAPPARETEPARPQTQSPEPRTEATPRHQPEPRPEPQPEPRPEPRTEPALRPEPEPALRAQLETATRAQSAPIQAIPGAPRTAAPVVPRAPEVGAPSPRVEPRPQEPRREPSPAEPRPAEPRPAETAPAAPVAAPVAEPVAPFGASTSDGEDVDRFSLAREFSRLLQDDQDPADG